MLRRIAIASVSCVVVLALAAGTAAGAQPVTVDFTGQGTATVNGQISPAPCNGAPIYATFTDVIPFHWEARFNTTIQDDETIVDEPGYLVSHDFGSQSADAAGSGGDDSSGCNLAIAMSIQPCPRDVPADATTAAPPKVSDPDRAAHQEGPRSYENVDIQGPLHLGLDDPVANGVSIGCGLGFNDVSMPPAFPIDGSTCAAGNNGVAYVYCTKDVTWSGTVTITPRADDCTEGATEPPTTPCPPAKPVRPFAVAHDIRGPGGRAATTGGALDSGAIPVTGSVSGPATVSGSLTTAKHGGSGARARDAKAKRTVIARARTVLRKAKRFTLRLRLTKRGRALLRSWRKPRLTTHLAIAVKSHGGHTTHATRTIKLRRAAPGHARR